MIQVFGLVPVFEACSCVVSECFGEVQALFGYCLGCYQLLQIDPLPPAETFSLWPVFFTIRV